MPITTLRYVRGLNLARELGSIAPAPASQQPAHPIAAATGCNMRPRTVRTPALSPPGLHYLPRQRSIIIIPPSSGTGVLARGENSVRPNTILGFWNCTRVL